MIGHRINRHQVESFHLITAFFLLILTVYPYLFNVNICCSVSAFSSDDFDLRHKSISKFDIIQNEDISWSRPISLRHTIEQSNKKYNEPLNATGLQSHMPTRKLKFSSLGRRFELILNKPSHLVTDDFKVVSLNAEGKATRIPFNTGSMQILNGFVDGDRDSRASVSFNQNDQLLIAQIKSGDDMFIVEPSYLHKDSMYIEQTHANSTPSDSAPLQILNKSMIVYNLNDHKGFKSRDNDESALFNPEAVCSGIKIAQDPSYNTSSHSTATSEEVEDIFKFYKDPKLNRRTRSVDYLNNQNKDKTRCTLHLVADYLFYKHIGNGNMQTTINYLLALVDRVNKIYLPTVWVTGDENSQGFSNIGFTVQDMTIHQEFTRLSSGDLHYNMESDKVWAAKEFLKNFSKYSPPGHYCLSHLLTYRRFDQPVLGLAYVASTRFGTIGGICSPTQQIGDIFYKYNTGISSSKGIENETLITRQTDLVVAHELGHNLGAEHDSNQCRPPPSSGGAYLMHPFAVLGFEKNNRFMSNCSRISIGRVIRAKAPMCFIGVIDHVCGNGIREDDEQCDGGDVGFGHDDPCCDSSCRLTPGSQCSDRESLCCSKCHISFAGVPCRQAEEHNCKQAALCDGRSAECPDSPPVADNTTCIGRGLCKGGECIPFCENRYMHSCLCNNPKDACKLCCKATINGTCLPYDSRGPSLPDGVLCYRGICERGRCKQPIQDVVERLWDIIEDINFSSIVKFLRDNIIFVVLVVSIPIWCICSYYINEFDKRIKLDVMNAIVREARRRKGPQQPSSFLPRLFVGDEISYSDDHLDNGKNMTRETALDYDPL